MNKFAGPLLARLTKLYHVYLNVNLLGHHELHNLHKLHQRYKLYVRIGPNDLSVVDAGGMSVVLGPGSKCRKSAWYGQDMPYEFIFVYASLLAVTYQSSTLCPLGSLIGSYQTY